MKLIVQAPSLVAFCCKGNSNAVPVMLFMIRVGEDSKEGV